ncbi:glutathione S-transferase family protein [Ancylobacter oerskovii]|uniref:Glutathione S-transferase family protein n=1 Tax=Ancylobacter oerskovii TaxID=459519 RepID=A0ABW4Z231_9HYPH|nr:glutathione S-transferase family protein [Ancylobacter oerskovii]MBS7544990.1 glutathione S-transferase family protein [Ancylobacter oerskovii]
MTLKLLIGNKNYSSWSLRPWLLLKAFGIAFDEEVVLLGDADFKARIAAHSPARQVPVLIDGEVAVWETLAIIEHIAERFPDTPIWPAAPAARAYARSIATEMHGGFGALRSAVPMNLWRPVELRELPAKAVADLDGITARWRSARQRFGAGGDFLFGGFSAADAMYAPVATRIRTYGLPVDAVSAAYVEAIHAHPAFAEWKAAALKEEQVLPVDEVDWPEVKRV